MLAPRLQSVFLEKHDRIEHGIIKQFGSFNLGGWFLCNTALHSSFKYIVLNFSSFFFLDNICFMNMA